MKTRNMCTLSPSPAKTEIKRNKKKERKKKNKRTLKSIPKTNRMKKLVERNLSVAGITSQLVCFYLSNCLVYVMLI